MKGESKMETLDERLLSREGRVSQIKSNRIGIVIICVSVGVHIIGSIFSDIEIDNRIEALEQHHKDEKEVSDGKLKE